MDQHKSKYDFLATWDKENNFIGKILRTTQLLRKKYSKGLSIKNFNSGIAISIFKDKSTRTRYSFATAASMLGLGLMDFDEEKSQISHGETIMETINMLSFATRAIGIRDDIFLGVGHKYMRDVSSALDWGFKKKVLPFRPSVINLQSDEDHPTQSLSDLSHLVNYFEGLKKLKEKKITISWAYSPSYGKPLSVPQGAIALLSRFGMDITLAYPKGYNLIPEIEKYAQDQTKSSGGKFRIVNDPKEAFKDADI
ncbi:MAG: knotted carbamoyltransferase YgeW, partial [Patescibacteria group bacterium]